MLYEPVINWWMILINSILIFMGFLFALASFKVSVEDGGVEGVIGYIIGWLYLLMAIRILLCTLGY
jgi:hypothetical protein